MGILETREESGGRRHYLDGRPVHAGEFLEITVHSGAAVNEAGDQVGKLWLGVRYEWNFRTGSPPCAYFVLADGPDGLRADQVCFELPERAMLRWPLER